MKILAAILSCFTAAVWAADDFAELRTLDGKLYKQVKVTKTSPAEIRVMHSDGFAIIPLSQLPPDVLARFGGKVNKNDEELAVMRRKLDNTPVFVPTPQKSAPVPVATAPLPSAQQPQAMRADQYIAAAIANRRLLMIAYDNGAEGPRLVEPHLLGVNTAGHWALSGWFRAGASKSAQGEGWRTYLLEKITAMEMVDQVFDARPGYDPNGGGLYQTISARLPGAVVAAPQAQAAPRVLAVDFIDGEFTGFEAGKKFKLMSGQVLQQMDGTYLYHYSYGPKITIYQAGQGTLMKVQGVEQPVLVMPVQ